MITKKTFQNDVKGELKVCTKGIPKIIGIPWEFMIQAKLTFAQSRISLVNKIRRVYQSQWVQIHNRHIEAWSDQAGNN